MLIPTSKISRLGSIGSSSSSTAISGLIASSIVDGVSVWNDNGGGGAWQSVLLTTLIRGGEMFAMQQSQHLDIGRVKMRLEGLQAYGTLCALLANGCLRLYSSVSDAKNRPSPNNTDQEDNKTNNKNTTSRKKFRKRLALDCFFLCIVLSVLSGSYTTVVFTLLPLYSKMALGRGYDKQFLAFWASTAHIRQNGFNAFLCSLVSFEIAFVLSLYLRTHGRRKRMLVLVASIICIFSFWEWTTVMHLASQFLFPLRAEVAY